MGGKSSKAKLPTPDFVWLSEVPYIHIKDKQTAEVCLLVNATCCAYLLLQEDLGEDRKTADFILYENQRRCITLQGLKPGCLYRAHFFYRISFSNFFSGFVCFLKNQRKTNKIENNLILYQTPSELSLLLKARNLPLSAIKQPSTYPTFYEVRTLPREWDDYEP